MKTLKKPRQLTLRYSVSSVAEQNHGTRGVPLYRDSDRPFKGELEGVRNQTHDNLFPGSGVHIYGFRERRAVDDELQTGTLNHTAQRFNKAFGQLRKICGLANDLVSFPFSP